MRTLLYVVLSILAALVATFAYGFLYGGVGVFFPSIGKNPGGGAIVFWSALVLALIYSRSRLMRESEAKARK